jgi:hypothetical protein
MPACNDQVDPRGGPTEEASERTETVDHRINARCAQQRATSMSNGFYTALSLLELSPWYETKVSRIDIRFFKHKLPRNVG